jgi:deoxyribodipyrimidine photo-lyase
MTISIFWFRRDLRIEDNTGLSNALKNNSRVLPIFIFDNNILKELPDDDPRVQFIHASLNSINQQFKEFGSGIRTFHGDPLEIFQSLTNEFEIDAVYFNKDYEPYSRKRDESIYHFLNSKNIAVFGYKDQVIFERNDILKKDGKPYTVYTPYKNRWLERFSNEGLPPSAEVNRSNLIKHNYHFHSLNEIGFKKSDITVRNFELDDLSSYAKTRDLPSADNTSYLSPHLRFGTVSIRSIVEKVKDSYPVFLSELIWREFFMQILFHYPNVVENNFKRKYDKVIWQNDPDDFEKWCNGRTGYPMVDAGMRQLNQTGYMHNRVRMITASFLCKHLLIDWRWGEAYFAKKLLDFELASNNGNWQWAAGTGCDAAPYFRVFNPYTQQEKFDREHKYINKWIPEYNTDAYPKPMVEHKFARERAIQTYKTALG